MDGSHLPLTVPQGDLLVRCERATLRSMRVQGETRREMTACMQSGV